MSQSTWAKTRGRHLAIIGQADTEPTPKLLHVTTNSKTGASVDFPPHSTCRPTAVCMGSDPHSASCYALSGFMGYPNAVRRHALNQRLVDSLRGAPLAEVRRVADALWSALPKGREWLRWNGAGDLTAGACRVINSLTRHHPDLTLWVVTRKSDEAARLKDRASLRLLLSLDHSTSPLIAARLRALAATFVVGRARLAYTRVSEADIPPRDAWVVFNKHNGGWFNAWEHKHVCPASLPGTEHDNACDSCRRCFK